MSNAYVFESAPLEGDGPPAAPIEGDAGPVPFVLLAITALVLAGVIVLLLVRCCGGSDSPQVALAAAVHHIASGSALGVVR